MFDRFTERLRRTVVFGRFEAERCRQETVHGVHLLGGIGGLSYLAIRARRKGGEGKAIPKETSAGMMSLYWHTMDGLWIWLFLLLLILK